MDVCDNEKRQNLGEYKSKSNRYIPFSFYIPHLSLRKESNYMIGLSQRTKRLNNILYILKIRLSDNCILCIIVFR